MGPGCVKTPEEIALAQQWNGKYRCDELVVDEVDRYCVSLADYTRLEPLPSTDFYIAYGRTLAAFGRGLRDKATVNEIERLRDEATGAGLTRSIPRLDRALAEASFGTGSPA